MAPAILQKAGKEYGRKVVERKLEQYTPVDPVYDYYTDAKGKKKRRKRSPPPGLSKHDIRILQTIQSRAHTLDRSLSIFHMRFGYTAVLGFFPLLGPSLDLALSYLFILRKVRQLEIDVPSRVVRKMLMNTLLGTGVAILLPVFGDVFMAVYKPNSRNALLLEKTLRNRLGKVRVKDPGMIENSDTKQEKIKKDKAWWKSLPKFRRPNNSNDIPK